MNIKPMAVCALLATSAVCAAKMPQWKADVATYISIGQFSTADSILSTLPEGGVERYRYVIDSLQQVMQYMRADFSLEPRMGRAAIKRYVPNLSDEMVDDWIADGFIETMTIDGEEWWADKTVDNLRRLDELHFGMENELARHKTYSKLYGYYTDAMLESGNDGYVHNWHTAEITFSLDVKADAVPDGEKIKVWLPFPFDNARQRNIKLLQSSHKVKKSGKSKHHTVYMEAKAEAGIPTHFEVTYSYEVGAEIHNSSNIARKIKPYNTKSKEYRRYTSSEYPHIVCDTHMRHLADSLTSGGGTPLEQAGAIYNWIADKFTLVESREYSTISSIPAYVLEHGYGDSGQLTLLYISLLRSAGIPARWESGWMLYPGLVAGHDWCEVYFEGVGWVPCDVSLGGVVLNEVIGDYYKTCSDVYRLATNECIGGELNPRKKYVRSSTVDFLNGEVEWKGGNLPRTEWTSSLKVNKFKRIGSYRNEL